MSLIRFDANNDLKLACSFSLVLIEGQLNDVIKFLAQSPPVFQSSVFVDEKMDTLQTLG